VTTYSAIRVPSAGWNYSVVLVSGYLVRRLAGYHWTVDTTEAAYREAAPGLIPQEYLVDRAVESGSHLDKHLDFYLSVVAFEWLMVFAELMLFAVLLFGLGLSLLIHYEVSQD
jgi:hypothetical protein